jgi:hypothetical protein
MAKRKASAVWEGTLREGKGRVKLGSGAMLRTLSPNPLPMGEGRCYDNVVSRLGYGSQNPNS